MANYDEHAALHPASVDGGDLIDLGHQLPFYLPPTAPQDFRLEDIDNFSLGAVSQRDSDATDRSINGSSLPPAGDDAAVTDPAEGDEAANGLGKAVQGESLVAAGESATKSAEAVKPKVLKRMTKEEFEESLGIKQKKKTAKKAAVKKTTAKKAVTKKGAKKSEKTIPKVAKGVKKAALKTAAKKNAKTKEESPKKTSVSFQEPKSSPVKKTSKGVKKNQKKASKGILKKNTKTAKKAAVKTIVSGRTTKR